MSETEAEQVTQKYEYWDAKHAKRDFISRMERKLHRKEQQTRY
jgi:hypothetical protein